MAEDRMYREKHKPGTAPINGGQAASHDRRDGDSLRIESIVPASMREGGRLSDRNLNNVQAAPKATAKSSRNAAELASFSKNGNPLDKLDVAKNPFADKATVNYIARSTQSDATQLAVLRRSELDEQAVLHFAKSTNVAVRTAAKNRPEYKPTIGELAGRAYSRLVHGAPRYGLAA